jgi:hypothetical protein
MSSKSSDDSARRILKMFADLKARPGHVLKDGHVFLGFAGSGFDLTDFKPGLEYAVEQGWVEVAEPSGYRLTTEGFSAAHS